MEKEITIVTAFFNINRDNWKGFGRTEEQYFNYFTGWAKLKNKIIAYVETEEMRDKILAFRRELCLEEKTIVNTITNCFYIAPDLYESIKIATENQIQQKYRLFPNNPEVWNAEYDYIMLMKMWCVSDAIERNQAEGMVAWMDFGYNHGGAVLDIKSDFNFKWKYDFPDKINLFLIQDLDNRPIFDIIFNMDTYIMGMMIVGADYLWKEFWNLMQTCMKELNACGITDDDQNIILMAYRKRPELFNTYRSSWQLPLKQFGGDHLKLIKKNKGKKLIELLKTTYKSIRHRIICGQLCMRIYKYIVNINIH